MRNKRINVVFIIPSLVAGGAERVMSYIAMHLDKDQFSTHLLVIGSSKNQSYLVEGIPVTFLNKKNVRSGVFHIANFLRSYDVDIVFSSLGHVNTLMAMIAFFFPKIKFVGRETNVMSVRKTFIQKNKNPHLFNKIKYNLFNKLQYTMLDGIICQSIDMKNDLIANFNYPKKKLYIINNPITKTFLLKNNRSNNVVKEFITVGRLTKQKGYLRILRALTKLSIPFHYTIIGQGEEENIILEYINEKGLEGKITHIPFTRNVENYLSKSDLYLQGSFVEGFPNALLESCAVGTPVLAFNAPGGINEIIQSGINGYIAEDENDFLDKLKMVNDKVWDLRIIRDSVMSRYSETIILRKYEDFFKMILKIQ